MRLAQFGKEIQRAWRKRDRIGAIEIVQFALCAVTRRAIKTGYVRAGPLVPRG
jgi:hypothetical protein